MNTSYLAYSVAEKVCKAVCKCNIDGAGNGVGSGFFGCVDIDGLVFRGLFTNCHVIGRNYCTLLYKVRRIVCRLDNDDTVTFFPPEKGLRFYGKKYSQELDVTFIELPVDIFDQLSVYGVSALDCRVSDPIRNNEPIVIGQHPGGEELKIMVGRVEQPQADGSPVTFAHNVTTQRGSSGSPVADYSGRVIGIHVGEDADTALREAISMATVLARLREEVRAKKAVPLVSDLMYSTVGRVARSSVCDIVLGGVIVGRGSLCKLPVEGRSPRFGLLTSSRVISLETLVCCSSVQCNFADVVQASVPVAMDTTMWTTGGIVFLELSDSVRKTFPQRKFLETRSLRPTDQLFCIHEMSNASMSPVTIATDQGEWNAAGADDEKVVVPTSAGSPVLSSDNFVVAVCAFADSRPEKRCYPLTTGCQWQPIWHACTDASETLNSVDDIAGHSVVTLTSVSDNQGDTDTSTVGTLCRIWNPLAKTYHYGIMTHYDATRVAIDNTVKCQPVTGQVFGSLVLRFSYSFACRLLGATFLAVDDADREALENSGAIFLSPCNKLISERKVLGLFGPTGEHTRLVTVSLNKSGIHLVYSAEKACHGAPVIDLATRKLVAVHKAAMATDSRKSHGVLLFYVTSAIVLDQYARNRLVASDDKKVTPRVFDEKFTLETLGEAGADDFVLRCKTAPEFPEILLSRRGYFWYFSPVKPAEGDRETATETSPWFRLSQCDHLADVIKHPEMKSLPEVYGPFLQRLLRSSTEDLRQLWKRDCADGDANPNWTVVFGSGSGSGWESEARTTVHEGLNSRAVQQLQQATQSFSRLQKQISSLKLLEPRLFAQVLSRLTGIDPDKRVMQSESTQFD